MTLKPIGPRLIVQYRKLEPRKGAIIIPNEEAPQFATVIDLGSDDVLEKGERLESVQGIRRGDLIGLHRHAGTAFKVEDQLYLVVEMKDVIAKLE